MVVLSASIFFVILAYFCSTSDAHPKCGIETKSGQVRFIVSVQQYMWKNKKLPSFQHICSGAIISPTFVLTAANCATKPPSNVVLKVVGGISDLNDKGSSREESYVAETIIHPKYKGGVINPNDIALLRLNKQLKVNNFTKTISLPTPRSSIKRAKLYGWSSLYQTRNKTHPITSDVLLATLIKLIPTEECLSTSFLYEQFFDVYSISTKDNICTQNTLGELDYNRVTFEFDEQMCVADAGSPLVFKKEVIGIATWMSNFKCVCFPNVIVYTKVESYLAFIQKHVKDLPKTT